MPRHRRNGLRLLASIVLSLFFATASPDERTLQAAPYVGCTLTDEVQGTTCPLRDGETVEGALGADGGSATYRFDAFSPGSKLALGLGARGGPVTVTVLDWRNQPLASVSLGDGEPDAHLEVDLPLRGVYGVRVNSDVAGAEATYTLSAGLTFTGPAAQPSWPPALVSGDRALDDERRPVRVRASERPTTGIAVSRVLGAPPSGIYGDFTLVADVRFEQIVGPSALTVRFRYEPEAGGGTGYFLSIDPFARVVWLDAFEEGQRRRIVERQALPIAPSADKVTRLELTAEGTSIVASLDGQPILEASDSRFSHGLIAIGAVTWSDAVVAIYDHVQVTTPIR